MQFSVVLSVNNTGAVKAAIIGRWKYLQDTFLNMFGMLYT